jgi:NADH dehydrogenase
MIARVIRRARKKRIVILGGGFGGVYAAIHLEKLLARERTVKICLVSRENFFLFTPMLHEIAASDLEITNIVNPLRKLLRKVEVLVGDVNEIDLPKRCRGHPDSEFRQREKDRAIGIRLDAFCSVVLP